MAAYNTFKTSIGIRDLGFGFLSLISVALTLIVQFVWMVIFDSTGLDVYTSSTVFMHVLPAISLAVIPTATGLYLYTRKTALLVGGAVLAASFTLSFVTVEFFRLCGPGC